MARAFEIMVYKRDQELKCGTTLSAETLSKMYSEKGELNDLSESVSKSFVDAASTCHRRALSIPSIRDLLLKCEAQYGIVNPFQSIYTLEALVKRAETEDNIMWAIASILHALKARYMMVSEINSRTVVGKGTGGKGIVDRANLRREFSDLLASTYAQKFSPDTRDVVMKITRSHVEYYTLFGEPGDLGHDISWVALLPESGQMLVRFVEVLPPHKQKY
eukprot:9503848-Pyramimonas_sp.AAC.2